MPRLSAGAALLIVSAAMACSSSSDSATVVAPRLPLLAKSTVPDPTATFRFSLDATGVTVTGDGAFTDGLNTVYADGVCGVWAPFFVSGSGDATYATNQPKSKDLRCAAWPRRIRVTFPDGMSEMTYTGTNLRQIENATYATPLGRRLRGPSTWARGRARAARASSGRRTSTARRSAATPCS